MTAVTLGKMNHCNVSYIMYAADSKGNKEIFYVKEKDQRVISPDFLSISMYGDNVCLCQS